MTCKLRDVAGLAVLGMRVRPLRAALSAAGVAIGVAAMVAVLGISDSSRADLLAQLDRLGTNLLTVSPGRGFGNEQPVLPATAPAMIRRIGPVWETAAIGQLDTSVRRSAHIPTADTGAITVAAAESNLLNAVGGRMAQGRFLDPTMERFPTVVLGRDAAAELGVEVTDGQHQVFVGDQPFVVIGVMQPVPLVPELDRSALVGFPETTSIQGRAAALTTVFVRTDPDNVPAVQAVLALTADPAHPNAVSIGRPSDALAARAAAKVALTTLFLGLVAVSLLVGGLGVANVMVVAVLERRTEIGLRRALGATRRDVVMQFVAESLSLSSIGGLVGVALGTVATVVWSGYRRWPVALSPLAVVGGFVVAALVGGIAGLYPAGRAARLSPSEALRIV